MDQSIREYLARSLAPATMATYRSAVDRYLSFCAQLHLPPLPLTQDNVSRFVACIARSGVAYQSIRVYLAGLRFYQVMNGLPDPGLTDIPLLGYVLRGIRRCPRAVTRQPRLPITPEILQMLFSSWSHVPVEENYDATMLWAATSMAFFGFMRAGEFTCSSRRAFSPSMLSPQDISVDSHTNPTMVSIRLRQSKTDPFGMGVIINLGRTGHTICPVVAILSYLARRGQQQGPLFIFKDGSCLSRQRLIASVNCALQCHGIDTSRITGHSFRIGAATAAARAGMEDSLIRTLGRWRSDAYLRYIHIPGHCLAAASTRLVDSAPPSQQRR